MDTQLTIRMDSDLKNWLKEYAYQNRETAADVVRDLLTKLKAQNELDNR